MKNTFQNEMAHPAKKKRNYNFKVLTKMGKKLSAHPCSHSKGTMRKMDLNKKTMKPSN